MRHGTRSMYVKGCHCADCRRANADYQARYGGRVRDHRMERVWRGDEMACPCWCELEIIGVTPAEVRAGKTRSCGRPLCTERVSA